MNLKPKIIEARDLAQKNAAQADRLRNGFEELQVRNQEINDRLQRRIEVAFDASLVPFADSFARLKNVDLENPDLMDRVPKVESASPAMMKVSLGAVKGLVALAGGASLGAGAGAVTFASVAAFATASTGTAIGTLSGAAATSATLAWLGGGSLAAGGLGMAGGMAVLAGAVAVPAIVALGAFVSYRGRKELAKQQAVAADLRAAQKQLKVAGALVDAVDARARDAEQTLRKLTKVMAPLNGWLANMVSTKPNYLKFDASERDRLAMLVGLATAMATVMQAPLVTKKGEVNPNHQQIVDEAKGIAREAAKQPAGV